MLGLFQLAEACPQPIFDEVSQFVDAKLFLQGIGLTSKSSGFVTYPERAPIQRSQCLSLLAEWPFC